MLKKLIFVFFALLSCLLAMAQTELKQRVFEITVNGEEYGFKPDFLIIYSDKNPELALKPAGIKKVSYNVPTWRVSDLALADFNQKSVSDRVAGDGFDDRILRGSQEKRTANIYHVGDRYFTSATRAFETPDSILYLFEENELFEFKAWIHKSAKPYPQLHFLLTPKKEGFFSVGYIGAPAFEVNNVSELWQPLIWTEKRAPLQPYMSPAFMATLPTTLVNDGNNTMGVMADEHYLPFQPLPLLGNSQFGLVLLNDKKQLQTQVFAPMPGGFHSQMKTGVPFHFSLRLIVEPLSLTKTYEQLATAIFRFDDYRTNATVSMNTTLDNLIDYSKTHYAWFVDSLKGFAYSTDVPGAVKNVSSLNPLELSIVRDDSAMFETRAYPLMEFMLSREKFLFALDSLQKIQSPSRKLRGPIAPLSELQVLYNVFGKNNSFYPAMAKKEFDSMRVRNLDVKQKGKNWMNALFLYKMTNDTTYLNLSRRLADAYLKTRVDKRVEQFGDSMNGSNFFWPTFTANWSALFELYEATGDRRYLEAAHDAARHYTLFTWMGPKIPDSLITVNKGGKAPMYWYLKSKGHRQMYYPEEQVPAWRLSEIGLTPESSGTSTGHRGIFMATYAPWLLRIGYFTQDPFLMNVGKASLVGRSESFPGYHINTERTTAYEKVDFPLHEHKEQSVNSFHYNHILPMASLFIDYLLTDAFVKSAGNIDFPNEYIEGYAYLQNKFYGHAKGKFYEYKDIQLWMPSRLLKIDDIGLNYVSAKKNDTLFLAFTNQSKENITTDITINPAWVKVMHNSSVMPVDKGTLVSDLRDSTFQIIVPANGITSVAITGCGISKSFQEKILTTSKDHRTDYVTIPEGDAKALLFKLGDYGDRLYVFLQEDDNIWKSAKLVYSTKGRSNKIVHKNEYPFEFTVPVDKGQPISFYLELVDKKGVLVRSKKMELGK